MGGGDIRVVHAIPGRIRLKIQKLKNDPAAVNEVVARLRKLPGIDRVEASPTTGSVVVSYGTSASGSDDITPGLSEAFGHTLFPGADPAELRRQLTQRTNGSAVPTPLASRIQSFLGGIDYGVERASRGTIDLRVLVPIALFCAGLAILSTSGTLPVPTWYDLMWASFATFVALNQVVGQQGTHAREPDHHP
jgi:hypothetical protein